jgi:hypothetical protein
MFNLGDLICFKSLIGENIYSVPLSYGFIKAYFTSEITGEVIKDGYYVEWFQNKEKLPGLIFPTLMDISPYHKI